MVDLSKSIEFKTIKDSNKKTQIIYSGSLPPSFDEYTIREVYGYEFELVNTDKLSKNPNNHDAYFTSLI